MSPVFGEEIKIGWDELLRQLPVLAVSLGVAWYAFRHIAKQQEDHLKDIRSQAEQTIKMLNDAHARAEKAKDSQITELHELVKRERDEKERPLKTIEQIGGSP